MLRQPPGRLRDRPTNRGPEGARLLYAGLVTTGGTWESWLWVGWFRQKGAPGNSTAAAGHSATETVAVRIAAVVIVGSKYKCRMKSPRRIPFAFRQTMERVH